MFASIAGAEWCRISAYFAYQFVSGRDISSQMEMNQFIFVTDEFSFIGVDLHSICSFLSSHFHHQAKNFCSKSTGASPHIYELPWWTQSICANRCTARWRSGIICPKQQQQKQKSFSCTNKMSNSIWHRSMWREEVSEREWGRKMPLNFRRRCLFLLSFISFFLTNLCSRSPAPLIQRVWLGAMQSGMAQKPKWNIRI